ncbi:MAG: hypothetical protein HY690_09480 [Chloroflexi bacterium]|nr:hypothetical protein [Chloroflexota bacterium]
MAAGRPSPWGVRLHGRVQPVAWSLLPYPWPKGTFTATVIQVLDRTLGLWPTGRPCVPFTPRPIGAFPA